MSLRPFADGDREAVKALWQACGLVVPQNDPDHDIDLKKSEHLELFWLAEEAGAVVGSVMAGYDGHRGHINYLAVHPDFRLKGLGKTLMAQAEASLKALGCPKINLELRSSNLAVLEFYKRIGYGSNDCVSLGKRL